MKKLSFSIFLALVALACFAQKPLKLKNEPGYHQHDRFFLSMAIGPDFSSIRDDAGSYGDYKYTGTAGQFDLKIGGAIQENLILHATIISNYMEGPKVKSGGSSVRAGNDVQISEGMIGGGFTYYVMPQNIFLSASAGIGGFTMTIDNTDYDATTDNGFSFQLKAGKEWWVGKNWGLGFGISYQGTYLTNKPETGVSEKMSSSNLGIHFNATFN